MRAILRPNPPDAAAFLSRRTLLAGGAASLVAACSSGRAEAQAAQDALTPEMFGARGDGVTNDSDAFDRLVQEVSRRGGGTVAFRRTTYLVGRQVRDPRPGAGYAFAPARIMQFRNLPGSLTILGNGAVLRCAPGLRYGTFDPATGRPTRHPVPYLNPAERASPYEYMIFVDNCAGAVTISDLELDGNLKSHALGGPYGDTGIQIAASGLVLRNNRGSEILRNIYAHHHPQDGIIIDGIEDPALAARVTRRGEGLRCEHNGRQGCSLVGGRDWTFTGSKFNHTGKAGIGSSPAAGFDIEAEGGKTIRNVTFEDCEFVDNVGCGLVADSGDSQNATFTRCRFVGTTMWSAWPNKPFFRFRTCTFVGTLVRCYSDPDPKKAAQFYDCTFTDDPRQSPTRQVYREDRPDGPLADLADGTNVRFDHCRFLAIGGAVLPWSTNAIYANCSMRQTSKTMGYPRGIYLGRTTIETPTIGLLGAKNRGELYVNGTRVRDFDG
ncbi:MAG: hypothetical protein QOH86_1102 [Sphingomonadales bacterium]|jgi:hypothetical protein|nr:hypothetical protein [Sphingomonadales bacterium]